MMFSKISIFYSDFVSETRFFLLSEFQIETVHLKISNGNSKLN